MQFGHLFAKGDNREGAIRAMVVALKEVKIRGEIRTTVDYCVEMIQSPDFVGNNIHTGWLDARITSHVSGSPCPWPLIAGLTVAAAATQLLSLQRMYVHRCNSALVGRLTSSYGECCAQRSLFLQECYTHLKQNMR